MIWISPLTWQEWILGSLFLLFSAIYLYRLNRIAKQLKTSPHTRVYLKFILRTLVIGCAIIALMGPSFGYIKQDQVVQSKNWNVYVDVSKSMDAQDVAPSRLEEVKKTILSLTTNCPNDYFSLSAFGPSLQTLCPLTSDHDAYKLFISHLSTQMYQYASSNGKESFELLYQELLLQSKEDKKKQRSPIVLIFSDGEFHTPVLSSTLYALKNLPYHYIVIGAGSSIPTPILVNNTALKDEDGKKIFSQIDRTALRQIASELKGNYFDCHDMEKIMHYTAKLPGITQVKDKIHPSMNKYFYFMILSFLFMVLDIVITVKTMTI